MDGRGAGDGMVSGVPCVLDAEYLGIYRACDARLSSHSTLVRVERRSSGPVDVEVVELMDDVFVSPSPFQRSRRLQANGRGVGD